jgi:hypothetical protein
MWEAVSSSRDFGPVAVVASICLAIVATKAINAWRRAHAAKVEAELKMEMVSRGMNVEQIERVLAARLSSDASKE